MTPISQAQRERRNRRLGLPTQPDEPDRQVLPAVPDEVQSTAKALTAWIEEAEGDDRALRAEAARAVNDSRARPWKSVTAAVDDALG